MTEWLDYALFSFLHNSAKMRRYEKTLEENINENENIWDEDENEDIWDNDELNEDENDEEYY